MEICLFASSEILEEWYILYYVVYVRKARHLVVYFMDLGGNEKGKDLG
jgi:hypothetical protein